MQEPPSARDRAHKAYTLVLQRMPHGEGKNIAAEMAISPSDLTELKKKVEPVLLLLSHLGFKLTDIGSHCIKPAAYQFLIETHERVVREAPALVWTDE